MNTKREPDPTPLWVLSDHAAARMEQRGIRHDWIDRAIRFPDRTEQDPDDDQLQKVYKRIGENGSLVLRVVYNGTQIPYFVVTALWESQMGKKR